VKKRKGMEREAWLRRKFTELWERGRSECCEVRGSPIHGRGVFATRAISKGERIIEYIGELVRKKEGEQRAWRQFEKAQKEGGAGVYIFTLSKKWDIDGDVPWNTARLINHSCDPNCEAWIEGKRIFIYAMRDIEENEELTFNYGFDVDCYADHPCRCGSANCVGYIVGRDQWPELARRLEERKKPE